MMKQLYSLVFTVVLFFVFGCSDSASQDIKQKTVNDEVVNIFNQLKAGMEANELKKILNSSKRHLGDSWYIGRDGEMPNVDNFDTKDKLCFYIPRELKVHFGSNQYYPIDYANIIAVVIDKNKDCEEWNFYAKSLLLLSWKSYLHYEIVKKKKDYDILDDPQLQKYNDAITKAKKLHKPMMLVVFDAYHQGFNKRLKQTIESAEVKEIINNNFVYVEYKGIGNLDRTQIGSITAVPMTYFFNSNGKLVQQYRGAVDVNSEDYAKYINIMKNIVDKGSIKYKKSISSKKILKQKNKQVKKVHKTSKVQTQKKIAVKNKKAVKQSKETHINKQKTLTKSYSVPKSCFGCHGAHFEKRALHVSRVVKNMTAKQIGKALYMYKNNKSYGGAMKKVMQGQVKKYSNKELFHIAKGIKQL